MALIKCPECGKEVSDKAGRCPNCGYPLLTHGEISENSSNKKEIENCKLIFGINAAIGILGLLMFFAIFGSNGGISGNRDVMIVSWGILLGSITGLISIRKRSKLFTYIMVVPYGIACIECAALISYRPSYLIMEFVIGITILLTLWKAKKSNII